MCEHLYTRYRVYRIELVLLNWTSFFMVKRLLSEPRRAFPSCSKILQNFRFSSAAAVARTWPSGLRAECRILDSCAGISMTLFNDGYAHTVNWLWGRPCVDTISLWWWDQWSDVTCDPALTDFIRAPVDEFQKWICLSSLPPPVASVEWFQGHQASA